MKTGFRGAHPVAAFLFFAAAVSISMTATHPLILGVCFVSSAFCDIRLRGKKAALFILRLSLPAAVAITLFNGLFSHYGVTPLFRLPGGNDFTLEAVAFGLVFGLRAACALNWLNCFNEVVTNEKFIYLFGRLSPRTALVISMTLRFIPLISAQSREIINAEKGSGNSFEKSGLFNRFRAVARRLSVLTSWLLEKGIDTADSMRARGYGLEGRSSASNYSFMYSDAAVAALSVTAALVYFVLFSEFSVSYEPVIRLSRPDAVIYISSAYIAAALFAPAAGDILSQKKWEGLARRYQAP